MFVKAAAISAFVLALGATGAFAAPGHCPPGHAKKGWCGNDNGRPAAQRQHDDRDYREGYRDGRHDERHSWRRGERVSPDRYVVIDGWRDRGLPRPPSGHRYVRVDGDILLVAIATNVIAEVLLNR